MKRAVKSKAPDARRYRIELPNLIDDLGLSPLACRLYVHYKRVCGAVRGHCWEATKTTARICAMSTGSVSKAKRELQKHGLIEISRGRGDQSDHVSIVDIWAKNLARYSAARSSGERSRSPNERSRSAGETKKELKEEGTREESHTPLNTPRKRGWVMSAGMKDTADFICTLFPGRKRLSPRGEKALSHWDEDLPLNADEKEWLRWFYSVQHAEYDIHLRTRHRTAETLAANLYGAIESAKAYQRSK